MEALSPLLPWTFCSASALGIRHPPLSVLYFSLSLPPPGKLSPETAEHECSQLKWLM